MGQETSTSRGPTVQRTFWEVYTPRNVLNEIKLKLSLLAKSRAGHRTQSKPPAIYDGAHAASVGQFYDRHHDQFMQVYGDVIQAFRTKDIADLLNHQLQTIGFAPGQRVLDAGCGIAAPAIHFASRADIYVDAITISKVQYEVARQRIEAAHLNERVQVTLGDYHNLPEHFSPTSYDIVYFLESFGHSRNKTRLIAAAWDVLKPGGTLYIKDLFRRVPPQRDHEKRIDQEIRRINQAYHYEVGDLNAVLDDLRRKGFQLTSLKALELELQEFEDLAISNQFQELTGLALIEDWNVYVFPVDFFEIKCRKPEFSLDQRLDRHYLQNRYHRYLESQQWAASLSSTHLGSREP